MKILAIPGSIRKTSSTHLLLMTIENLFPSSVQFIKYDALATIPPFDDSEHTPVPVIDFRKQIAEADGVLIVTPEYAFGVPGVLKNALDWTVSGGELVEKPVGLITASTGGEKGHAAMLNIFTALSTQTPPECSLLISFIRSKLNPDGTIKDEATQHAIQSMLNQFIQLIKNKSSTN